MTEAPRYDQTPHHESQPPLQVDQCSLDLSSGDIRLTFLDNFPRTDIHFGDANRLAPRNPGIKYPDLVCITTYFPEESKPTNASSVRGQVILREDGTSRILGEIDPPEQLFPRLIKALETQPTEKVFIDADLGKTRNEQVRGKLKTHITQMQRMLRARREHANV